MRFIDTHAHLYSTPLKENIEGIMKNAMDNGIDTIIMPAIDSNTLEAMLEVEASYPKNCMAMMGLHPCSVKENVKEELAIIETQLQKRKFIAIGEIGLDYYWDKTFTAEQMLAFEKQMDWALDYKLPIVIHTRNAMGETIEAVKPFAKKGLRGIFHCFSGSRESAEQIIAMGFPVTGFEIEVSRDLTSDSLYLRCPPRVLIEVNLPAFAHLVTVLGSTRNKDATSAGVSNTSCSEAI